MTNRMPVRDRLGALGWRRGSAVPRKPGNAGGGKGPQFKTRRSKWRRTWRLGNLSTPNKCSEAADGVARESVTSCPREAMGGRRRSWHLHRPHERMEVAPWPKSMISAEALTAFDPISTLVVVVEMSKASWLVSGVVPGIERQPLKKLELDATALLRLIERWRKASHKITSKRREGFWEVSFPRGRTIWVNKARPTRRKIVQQTGVATLHPARELRNLQDY